MEGIPGPGAHFYSNIVANSPFIKDFYREVVEEICAEATSGRVLDIGTGPGLIPLDIARSLPDVEVKAIDISPAMVDIAVNHAINAGLSGQVQFQCGSAEKIPFPDECFDLVLSTLSFHHWAKPVECLKEVLRVLKKGGEMWIYEIKWDLTQENKNQIRKKYGRALTFMVVNFVRMHSSLSASRIQEVISLKELGYSEIVAEDKSAFVKLRLVK